MPDSSPVLSWLILAAFLGVCVLLIWLSTRIEPHWVSKNGQQFTCRVAELHTEQGEVGPWTEARVALDGEDALTVAVKPKLLRLPGRRAPIRRMSVAGRAESERKGLAVYLLTG